MQIQVHLDTKKFSRKPSKSEIGSISNRITSKVSVMSPKILAEKLCDGQSVLCGIMNGSRNLTNFLEQQVVMLDFDNVFVNQEGNSVKLPKNYYCSISNLLSDPFIQKNASFIYKTFNYASDFEKFRVVFILDKKIKYASDIEKIYGYLFSKYPYVDVSCKDSSRLFFGGIAYEEISFSNLLYTNEILGVEAESKSRNNVIENKSTVKPLYYHIREKNLDVLKNEYSIYAKKVKNKQEAVNYLKTLNLFEVLDITSNPFRDILKPDEKPSASIFYLDDGKCIYKRFGISGYMKDITLVFQYLFDLPMKTTLDILFDIFNISIENESEILRYKSEIQKFNVFIRDENLKENFPHIYKVLGRYKNEICDYIDLFTVNDSFIDEDNHPRFISWFSVRTISNKLYGSEKKVNRVSKLISLLSYLKIITKLDENSIPNNLLSFIHKNQSQKKFKYRSNVIEVKPFSNDYIQNLNNLCENLIKHGFSFKGFNKEFIERLEGKVVADEIYNQDKNTGISEKSSIFYAELSRTALAKINEDNFVFEKDLVSEMSLKFGVTYSKDKLKTCLPELIQAYSLDRLKTTKDIKLKYNITSLSPKQIFYILVKHTDEIT